MEIRGFEHRADAKRGCLELVVGCAEDGGIATGGLRQAEQHSQRGRLPGAIGSEETRNRPRLDIERQVVDGEYFPVAFAERTALNDEGHVLTFAGGGISSVTRSRIFERGAKVPARQTRSLRLVLPSKSRSVLRYAST